MTFIPIFPAPAALVFSLMESSGPGKIIILVLVIASIFAWTVMISKGLDLYSVKQKNQQFKEAFKAYNNPTTLHDRRTQLSVCPLSVVYFTGCENLYKLIEEIDAARTADSVLTQPLGSWDDDKTHITPSQMELVRNQIDTETANQYIKLEQHMGILASAVSTSPFLGLLGTVWGVMEAFSGMAVTGSATLSSVAPGISSALLTTIVGLIIAIPSAIGYNYLSNCIHNLGIDMENFADELTTRIHIQFVK